MQIQRSLLPANIWSTTSEWCLRLFARICVVVTKTVIVLLGWGWWEAMCTAGVFSSAGHRATLVLLTAPEASTGSILFVSVLAVGSPP